MSELLQCPSCGGTNQLPEGKTSMFCGFCGNAIEKELFVHTDESIIKAKPKISERKVKINKTKEEGDISWVLHKMGGFRKRRVDGGVEWYDGTRWNFARDKEKKEEIVLEEGGVLNLSGRNIYTLDEIIKWYSNNELDTITELNLAQNNITDINKITLFKNLKQLNLESNKISEITNPDYFEYIPNIIILNNPISETNNNLPINFTQNIIADCSVCGKKRSQSDINNDDFLCQICLEKSEEVSDEEFIEFLDNNKEYRDILMGPKKGPCFIATATFGSYNHPQVIELRNFRDEWILTKNWGSSFVKWYYYYGEKAAKIIDKSFVLKKISYLLIIKPLVYLSRIVNSK